MDDDVGFVDGDDDTSMDTDVTRRGVDQGPRSPALDTVTETMADDDEEEDIELADFGDLSSFESREEFLVKHLKIPEQWINESKAVLARSLDMTEEEAWYLIKAGNLDRAHKLLIDTIAPNAIINGELFDRKSIFIAKLNVFFYILQVLCIL